ncbi:MAG: PAS domain-containing protein [Sedimentisphaerales bacterium]|jgi:PAS domain S-box-containing protein
MRGSKKHDERQGQVRRDKKGTTKLEPLHPQAGQPDKLYNDLAKFPPENPYPVLRIHKNGTVLYANKASEWLLKARSSGMGQPAPAEWHQLVKKALSSGQVIKEETKHDGRVFAFRAVPIADSDYVNFYGVDITEQKSLEETLEKERQELRLIINSSPIIVFYKDKEGRFVRVNKPFAESLNIPEEKFLGKTVFDFYSAKIAQSMTNDDQEVFRTGRAKLNIEEQYESAKGLRWVQTDKVPIFDKDGILVGLVGFAQDITERKRAEEKLQNERNLLRTLFDNIPDVVYVKDKDSRFIACNKAVTDYWNIRGENDITGKTDFDLFEPTTAQTYFDEEQEVMRTGQPIINRESQCTDKMGNTNFLLVTKVPLRDSRDNITGLIGIHKDITERKKAEEDLVRLNLVMKTIADVNQCIFRIQDKDELMRKACEAIVKYAYRMAWIGFCDDETKMIAPQAQAGFEKGYLELVKITFDDSEHGMGPSGMAVKTGKPNIMRFAATDPRYEPWRAEAMKRGYLSSAAIPIWEADKVIGVLNVYAEEEDAFGQKEVQLLEELSHDISTGLRGIDEQTRRHQAEQKLIEYQKRLKRLAAQLTLAEERERKRIASELHDHIGQSLALAKIKLDALHASTTSQPVIHALEDIIGSLEKTILETRTLTFDLSSPILYELGFEAAVAEWLNEQVRDKHGIAVEFADDGLPKPLDDDVRVLLFRNVRELLINIIKHARAGKAKVCVRRTDGSIEVTVEDNGIGFDPMEIRSMTAKRTEFGLFSVRESLEELGGRFDIESKPGAGCKATMTAPLKREPHKKEG